MPLCNENKNFWAIGHFTFKFLSNWITIIYHVHLQIAVKQNEWIYAQMMRIIIRYQIDNDKIFRF